MIRERRRNDILQIFHRDTSVWRARASPGLTRALRDQRAV